MPVRLKRAAFSDAEALWRMQTEAFAELLARYRDSATNPGAETLERVREKLSQPFTFYYFILLDETPAGAIRVVDSGDPAQRKRISPLFILPEYRRRGLARQAVREAERLHGPKGWSLGTILQEPGNCRLYESLGYRQTGELTPINERLTIVGYEKG